MDHEARAWALFCSAVFVWMGVGLLLGAPEHADSALAWMASEGRPASEGLRRRLAFFYRAGGAFFAGFGVYVLFGAPFPPPALGRAGRIAGGAFFLSCGALLAAAKAAAGRRRGAQDARDAQLGLRQEPGTRGERAGRAWGWVIVPVFLAFGAYLLVRAGGHHV